MRKPGFKAWHSISKKIIIANEIRETIKDELGITASIGVSYNKIFAKLGSDLKKPDAVTVITSDNYKDVAERLRKYNFKGKSIRKNI